jgi:hypothetical protein
MMKRMHPFEKVMHKDPSASPLIPTIPEISPVDPLPVLRYGFPGTGSVKAMVFNTLTVDSRKGLINSTFILMVDSFFPTPPSFIGQT